VDAAAVCSKINGKALYTSERLKVVSKVILQPGSPGPSNRADRQNGKALYTEERLKVDAVDIFSWENGKALYTEERLKVVPKVI